ncbi:MAG: urease accessory protein UreF [Rhodobiaceae bacterium]|nr:urease accessory protein UreF [Rhodobiaceae bacterium]
MIMGMTMTTLTPMTTPTGIITGTTITTSTTPMTEPDGAQGASRADLARLMTWLSPSYPVGAFTYSHGIEWAVEAGDIATADHLREWLRDLIHHGTAWSDAVLFCHVWRAAIAGETETLTELADLAAALQPSAERALESTAQGRAFMEMTLAAWPAPALTAFAEGRDGAVTYPVAVAVAAAAHGVPLAPALTATLHALIANLISAGVRLVPLGQTAGQTVTAALIAEIDAVADAALAASLSDLGGAAWRSDIASMKHETQYTRLFRS